MHISPISKTPLLSSLRNSKGPEERGVCSATLTAYSLPFDVSKRRRLVCVCVGSPKLGHRPSGLNARKRIVCVCESASLREGRSLGRGSRVPREAGRGEGRLMQRRLQRTEYLPSALTSACLGKGESFEGANLIIIAQIIEVINTRTAERLGFLFSIQERVFHPRNTPDGQLTGNSALFRRQECLFL